MADQQAKSLDFRFHAVMLGVQFAFGAFHVVAKDLISEVNPIAMTGYRALLSAPLLFLLAWKLERVRPTVRDLPFLALLGFLGVFVNQLLFIKGLSYTTASNAGILMPSIPVFTSVAAVALRTETLEWRRIAGVLLAVSGAFVMLDITRLSFTEGAGLGNAIIFVNCMAYSFFLVLQKPIMNRLGPITVMAWSFLFGGLGIVAVGAGRMAEVARAGVSAKAVAEYFFVVIFSTVGAYALNAWAIRRSTSTLAATYTVIQTLITVLLAAYFLGDKIGSREMIGFVFMVAGLIIVSREGASSPQNADL